MDTENEDKHHQLTDGPDESTAFDTDNFTTRHSNIQKKQEITGRNSTGAILNTPSTAESRMVDKNTSKKIEGRPSEIVEFKPILEEDHNEAVLDNMQDFETAFKTADGAIYTGKVKRVYQPDLKTNQKQKKQKKTKSAEKNTTKTILHGTGKLTLKNGTVVEGEWVDNTINKATVAYKNGDYYEGEINTNYQPHGFGEMQVDASGSNLKGTWATGSITNGTEITKDGQ